jgi:hypothetical protein
MNKEIKIAKWKKIIEFYNDLIENHKWEQKPMLKLIENFKKVNFWNKYFPSTSHEALGLSLEFDSDKRFEMPMVYIIYKSKKKEFEIQYQKGQGNTTLAKNCGTELAKKDFLEIENWLSDKSNERTTPCKINC